MYAAAMRVHERSAIGLGGAMTVVIDVVDMGMVMVMNMSVRRVAIMRMRVMVVAVMIVMVMIVIVVMVVAVMVVSIVRAIAGCRAVNANLGRAPALHQQENSHPQDD
jgi:hypothetical protein